MRDLTLTIKRHLGVLKGSNMIKKLFNCDICETQGMISISSSDIDLDDIGHCPVCGSPLLSDDFEDEE